MLAVKGKALGRKTLRELTIPRQCLHRSEVVAWAQCIENRLHWVRDITFGEDASRVRHRSVPQILAAIRNAVIGLLRTKKIINNRCRLATKHLAISTSLLRQTRQMD